MSAFAWFCVGFSVGITITRLLFDRALKTIRTNYQIGLDEQRSRIDDLAANNEKRYVELRRRLGLPPKEREMS